MSLPFFDSDDVGLKQLQTAWAKILNPVIDNPAANPVYLKSVVLTSGANTIDHKLGRRLQGWIVVRQRGVSILYDTQDVNPLPNKTLQIMASSGVTVDLLLY